MRPAHALHGSHGSAPRDAEVLLAVTDKNSPVRTGDIRMTPLANDEAAFGPERLKAVQDFAKLIQARTAPALPLPVSDPSSLETNGAISASDARRKQSRGQADRPALAGHSSETIC